MAARDLQEGANDLAYEWQSAAQMSARLLELTTGDDPDPIARNAFLESGLLHYRCLVNFCCGGFTGKWHPDDMKPEDFLGRPWWPDDEELDRRLRGRLPSINQCLQHLSWGRAGHTVMWPYGLLAHEAHYAMTLFLREVPEEAPWRVVLASAQIIAAKNLPPRDRWRATAVSPAPARPNATRPPP